MITVVLCLFQIYRLWWSTTYFITIFKIMLSCPCSFFVLIFSMVFFIGEVKIFKNKGDSLPVFNKVVFWVMKLILGWNCQSKLSNLKEEKLVYFVVCISPSFVASSSDLLKLKLVDFRWAPEYQISTTTLMATLMYK